MELDIKNKTRVLRLIGIWFAFIIGNIGALDSFSDNSLLDKSNYTISFKKTFLETNMDQNIV